MVTRQQLPRKSRNDCFSISSWAPVRPAPWGDFELIERNVSPVHQCNSAIELVHPSIPIENLLFLFLVFRLGDHAVLVKFVQAPQLFVERHVGR